jgi:flagellar biosynthesis chaperone FliJ
MSQVIEMLTDEQRLVDELQKQIQQKQRDIDNWRDKINDADDTLSTLKINEPLTTDRKQKQQLKNDIKALTEQIKQWKKNVENDEKILSEAKFSLKKYNAKKYEQKNKESNKNTAEKVFDEHNIHYIIFDQQWWSVDPAGDRMSVKINSSEAGVIKDLIFNDSGREIQVEQELKALAKELGRMYKHMVRDFEPDRPGVYNQMNTIRKQWLEPIYDVTPHDSFRLLLLSIAGGDDDYADQLEKWVAYRYCNPQDVMVPNIDSCAIGGTGRDTFYNILRSIFTDECCGSVGTETFKGTHNGDLFGKMVIKVDEKDSYSVPIDKVKEFTGSNRYRHRAMNKDARDVARLFSFIFFRNGFTSTAKLAGTGTSGEDRRFEPIIARVNLPRHLAFYHKLINNINEIPDEATIKAMTILIKEWQQKYYKNETRISEWLGHIITKHNAKNMTELLPLHGKYYTEMLTRQKKGIDGFMPKFMNLMGMGISTVINITQAHKLYEAAESQKCKKDYFKNEMMYWLNNHMGWDCEEVTVDCYTWKGCRNEDRRKMTVVQNKLNVPESYMFNITDFIDTDATDEKGTTVGEKINVFSIRDELR